MAVQLLAVPAAHAMPFAPAPIIARVSISIAFAAVLSTTSLDGALAQQSIGAAPLPVQCVRYLNARQSEPVLPGATLSGNEGAIELSVDGQVLFSIPAAARRAQLITQNGRRPGSDYQYTTDRASTGAGYYWFETQYRADTAGPDVIRNELFVNGAGVVVSYSIIQKLQAADPVTGSREITVRCEPLATGQ